MAVTAAALKEFGEEEGDRSGLLLIFLFCCSDILLQHQFFFF